jgi:hypothetical protein
MGMRSLRASCSNCGGKVRTEPKGLGQFTWANSWFLVKTIGKVCPHCGAGLTGRVTAGNKAELAPASGGRYGDRPSPTLPERIGPPQTARRPCRSCAAPGQAQLPPSS